LVSNLHEEERLTKNRQSRNNLNDLFANVVPSPETASQ
jgi:hypothetical protein